MIFLALLAYVHFLLYLCSEFYKQDEGDTNRNRNNSSSYATAVCACGDKEKWQV